MSTLIFDDPEHILIIGKLSFNLKQKPEEVFAGFYNRLELFDYFSAQEYVDISLEQLLDKGFDFVALYDPAKLCVVDYLLSARLNDWLEGLSANKNEMAKVAKFRFEQMFLLHNFCKDIYSELVPGV